MAGGDEQARDEVDRSGDGETGGGGTGKSGGGGVGRYWVPMLIGAACLVGVVAVSFVSDDVLDRGLRNSSYAMIGLAGIVLLCVWVFFSSVVQRGVKLATAGLLALIVAVTAGAVRRVEFTGDMEPILEYRWTESAADVLEKHRREAKAAGPTAAGPTAVAKVETLSADDVPAYRGVGRDGVIEGPALSRDWTGAVSTPVWRQPIGGGYASFAVVGGSAYTIEQRRDDEAVTCYDVATGSEIWSYLYAARFEETLGGPGPRATPTWDENRIFALGATGVLTCLDATSGAMLWQKNLLEINEVPNLDWGMCGSPLVRGSLVIATPGAQDGTGTSRSVLAIDKYNGEVVWRHGEGKGSYCSPMLATLSGKEQILVFQGTGLTGHDAETGERLWEYDWITPFDNNAAQPVVVDSERVLFSSDAGAAMVRVEPHGDGWMVAELWSTKQMKCSYANPIVVGNYVYGLDKGIMTCLDLDSGERQWKGGRYGHGQMLLSDNVLIVLTEKGELVAVDPDPTEHIERSRFQAIEGKTWNNPALVNGQILVRNHEEMASYDLTPH